MTEPQESLDVPLGDDQASSREAWKEPGGDDIYDGDLTSTRDPPLISPAEDMPGAMESEKLPKERGPHKKPHRKQEGFAYRFRSGVRSIWRTKDTESKRPDFDQRTYITTTIRELVVYIIFLIVLCIIAFGKTSLAMYHLTEGIRELFVDAETPDEKTFETLITHGDFWNYMGQDERGEPGPFLSALYWEHWYDSRPVTKLQKGYVYYENRLLGLPRIRTLRVKHDSCEVPGIFEQSNTKIKNCWGSYSPERENRSAFGLQNGTAWQYSSSGDIDGTSYGGRISTYDGSGFYVDLPMADMQAAMEQIQILKQYKWTDEATRVVFADFTVYNANVNLFCVVKLIFEFPATGGIIPTYSFRTVKLIRYLDSFDYVVLASEIVFCIFIIYYIVEEIIEISKHRWQYVKNFWNLLDIVVILISVGCLSFSVYRTVEVENKLGNLLENDQIYENFDFLSSIQTRLNDATAILVFFALIKIFKYISFNKTMNQLSSTLSRCAKDMAAFGIIFAICFLAFGSMAYLVFGIQNMFLAIINDTYVDVKQDLVYTKNDFELGLWLKFNYEYMLRKLHVKRDHLQDIEAALSCADRNKDGAVDFEEWRFVLKRLCIRVERLDRSIQEILDKINVVVRKVQEIEGEKMRHREEIAKLVQKAFSPDKSASEKLAAFEGGLKKEMAKFAKESEEPPEDP